MANAYSQTALLQSALTYSGDTLGTPDRSGVSADSSELLSIAANSSNSSAAPASAPRKLRRRLWKQERAGDGQMEIPELPFGSVGARPPHAGSGSWGDSDGSNPLVNEGMSGSGAPIQGRAFE